MIYPSKETCSAQVPRDGIIGHNQCQLEPDRITLSCRISYVGNLKLLLEWTNTSGSEAHFEVTTMVLNGITTATLTLEDRYFRDATFACDIRYPDSNLTSLFSCSLPIKGKGAVFASLNLSVELLK